MRRLSVFLLLVAVGGGLHAQTEEEKVMAMYVEMARPVAEHKKLDALAGDWKVTTKFWFGAGDPQVYTGTARNRMILGGRFLQSDVKQRHGDTSMESLTLYGFDRRTSEYTLVGYDTLGTYYVTAAGKPDAGRGGVVMNGTYLQPPALTEQKYTFLWTEKGKSEHAFTLYFLGPDGKDMLVAETTFERAR
jgi:hypothetical protein